jgi:hypothetical protein
MSTPIIINNTPTPEQDLEAAPVIIEKFQARGVEKLRAREVEVLARLAMRYAPITMPEKPTELPRLSTPGCPGCGVAVAKPGELCSVCQQKKDARPVPLFDLGAHKAPAYAREPEAPSETP